MNNDKSTISFRCSKKTKAEIKEEADALGVSASEYCSSLIAMRNDEGDTLKSEEKATPSTHSNRGNTKLVDMTKNELINLINEQVFESMDTFQSYQEESAPAIGHEELKEQAKRELMEEGFFIELPLSAIELVNKVIDNKLVHKSAGGDKGYALIIALKLSLQTYMENEHSGFFGGYSDSKLKEVFNIESMDSIKEIAEEAFNYRADLGLIEENEEEQEEEEEDEEGY